MFLVALGACYVIFYLWQRYRKAYEDAPKTVPLWECIKILLKNTDLWTKAKEALVLVDQRGGVGCGSFTIVVYAAFTDGMTALKSCVEKAPLYELWEPWLGVGVFIGNIQVNKVHRKIFVKSQTPSNMDAFIKHFNVHSERLVQKLSSRVDRGPFDIVHTLRLFNLELVCDTMLAFDDVECVNFDQYLDAVSSIMRIAARRFQSMLLQHNFIFNRTRLKQKQTATLEVLHRTRDQIIYHRRKQLKEIQEKSRERTGHEIFLDALLEAADKGIITEKAMKADVDTIIFAGHDTSAYSLLYALVLLGSYPHVQERAYEEIQQVLGERKNVTKDDLSKLVYLEAIIKESTRVYPYVIFQPRQVDGDIKLKTCTMRAGCTVAVSTWSVHRHASWGPDAEQFRPERWLEPDKLPRPTVLLSFSEGARNCLGRRYAMLSMKTLLSHLVRNYRFKADHTKLRLKYTAVLEPVSGHHVAIEKRP